MNIETKKVKLSQIKLNPDNPRRISEKDMERLVKSLTEFPEMMDIREIVVDENMMVLGGNMRTLALRKAGAKECVAKIVTGLTPEQKKEFVIKDNGAFGSWDMDALANGWDDLPLVEWGVDLPEDWLDGKVQEDPADAEPQIDRAEELNKVWRVKTGDLWLIGEHRLLCGDSTKKEDVGKVMDGERAHLCFTSPPYAEQRDYKSEIKDWNGLMQGVFRNLPMREGGQVLVNLGLIHREGEWVPYWDEWISWMREQGWRRFGWYVWDQGFGLPGDWNGRFAPSHEWIFHFNRTAQEPKKWVDKKSENIKPRNKGESTMRGKDGKTKAFTNPGASGQPTKIPDSIVRVGRQVGSDGHPAQFPVELPMFILRCWPGVVYEPFLGSGSTMIAAENIGCECVGLELAPAYCAVILQRMADAFPGIEIKRITHA